MTPPGEISAALLNPTMATYEVAPLLTVIEKRMAMHLLAMFGIEQGEGIMVTGGSNANLLAILCARTRNSTTLRQTGVPHNRFRAYVSQEAHYSFDKAANISGVGTHNLVLVPSNSRGEMDVQELNRLVRIDTEEGFTPFMVGATAGTTVLGAFDPLPEIAKVCREHGMWFHVDAAWGGGALFSRSARNLLKGVELADSITFDAHKVMGAPLITSYFLTRHGGILKITSRGGGAEYLFHEDNADFDTGVYSLQCGRRADALKLWMLWRAQGTEGLIDRTEHLLELARVAREEVERRSRLKLLHASYLNLCFQVRPRDSDTDINAFTLEVRKALIGSGMALVNYAERDGQTFFRLVFPNHRTQATDLVRLLDMIETFGDEVEADVTAPPSAMRAAS